jgi:ribosomal protein S18 acetylase RimI-like enzyme
LASPEGAPVELRPATPEDRELLFRVYASTRLAELAAVPWSATEKESFLRQQFAAQDRWWRLQYPACSFSVIEVGGVAAGRLYVDRRRQEIRLVDIALLPEHRRGGVGSRLLRELQSEAAEAGLPLTIHVERFNPARALYERLGFREIESDSEVYTLMEWRAVS